MNNDLLGNLAVLGIAAVMATATLSGCFDGSSTDAEAGDETGDGDGDTAGDGDGDTSGDGDGDTTGDGDGDDEVGDGDGDGEPPCETHAPGDGAANGEACFSNGDCASKLCEVFQDVPPVEGSCQPAPDECRTRIMGRVLDFVSRDPVADVELRVAAALGAATDPTGTAALASATSAAAGEIDVTSDEQISAPLGIVGLAGGGDFFLTATGLASPADGSLYGPANAVRDIWVVPNSALTHFSGLLSTDPAFENQLPLGEAGGVVGLVRHRSTGTPVAGAVIVSNKADSTAEIRYLIAAGTAFGETETSSIGVFVIVKPGLGESFGVEVDGVVIDGVSATAGSANGAIFTMIMNVPG